MKKPAKLYKYEPVCVQALLNLKSQTLFFGPPSNFNDPYDFAVRAKLKVPSNKELAEFVKLYSQKEDTPESEKQQLVTAPKEQLAHLFLKIGHEFINTLIEKNINTRGVSCFSEVNDELLMWSHYADKYTGFCLEFDTNFEPFSKARKVIYRDSMPIVSIADAIINDNYEQFLDLYCTKSISWHYEKEWRCIHQTANTAWTYEPEALSSIYFGPEIDPQALEIICLIIQGQNPNVRFWRGQRSNKKFSVEFENFEYTNHLLAKQLGLLS